MKNLEDYVVGSETYRFTSMYIGLLTAEPGSGGVEPLSSGGYSRVSLKGVAWERCGKSLANVGSIYFPDVVEDWGTLTHIAIFNHSTPARFMECWGSLVPAREVLIGSTIFLHDVIVDLKGTGWVVNADIEKGKLGD